MNGHHSDRDRMLEQALKHELRAANQPPAPEACLDAETLAAWMDGGLDPVTLAAAEAHASTCERCQALIGTLARSTAHPALGTDPLAPGTEAPGTFRLWRWWLAPLAAATAAVVIWAVVPPRSDAPMLMSRVAEPVARAPVVVPESASPPAPAPKAARPVEAAPPAPAARDNAQGFSPVPAAPPAPRQQQLADAAKRPSESDRLAAVAAADREARVDAVAPAQPAPRAAAPPAAPPAAVPLPATAPPVATPAMAETAPAREEKAANRAATAAGAPAPADLPLRMRPAIPIEIVSPDPARRWRVSAEFAITRSEDGGRTWRQVRSAQGDRMTAGSAPSPDVCWFVGGNGLVLLTTDGTRFTRIAFPVQTDLTGVTAIDARTATVVAVDGRTFSTGDGGATWRQN